MTSRMTNICGRGKTNTEKDKNKKVKITRYKNNLPSAKTALTQVSASNTGGQIYKEQKRKAFFCYAVAVSE